MSKKSWDWKNKMVAAVLNSCSKEELSKIDALVAEHVMRWTKGPISWLDANGKTLDWDHSVYGSEPTFSPSTDIKAAWQVMEKLCESYDVKLCSWGNGLGWSVYLEGKFESKGPAPLAICLAALRVKGIEI